MLPNCQFQQSGEPHDTFYQAANFCNLGNQSEITTCIQLILFIKYYTLYIYKTATQSYIFESNNRSITDEY